jgi:hypothetical protein
MSVHGQFDGEVTQRPIGPPQDRKRQKDFAAWKPIAGVDHKQSNDPADFFEKQVADGPEPAIAGFDGIAIDCRCIPQHALTPVADGQRRSNRNSLIEYVRMVRRPTPSCDTAPRLACHVTPRLRDTAVDDLPPIRASSALDRSPGPTGPIVANEDNGGRLGNYADPVAEAGVSRSRRSRRRFRQQKWPIQIPPVRHWQIPRMPFR